jgi:hypothetical protein
MTSFYSGDLTPVLLTSGTEILAGATLTDGLFTEAHSKLTARLEKPMFYVIVTSTTTLIGTMTIGYQEKINEVYTGVDKTVGVEMVEASTNVYKGLTPFTNEFSAIKLKSVKNDADEPTVTFKVYLTGKIMY